MQEKNFLEELKKELKFRNYSIRTIDIYQTCVKKFLEFVKNDITKISKEKIYDFIFYLQGQWKAPKTLNLYKEAIKFFVKEILNFDLKIDIKLSKEEKKLPIVLTKSEIEKIFSKIKNHKHKFILELSYWWWLRVEEVVNLKVWDFDLENFTIHIKLWKWKKDRITIFSEKLVDKIKNFSAWKNWNEFLIESERWWKLTTRSLQKIFKDALKKSWIKKMATFHSLRHSFATHLLENWVDVRYIQELLWHLNLQTTQVYTKVMNKNIKNIKSPL